MLEPVQSPLWYDCCAKLMSWLNRQSCQFGKPAYVFLLQSSQLAHCNDPDDRQYQNQKTSCDRLRGHNHKYAESI